MRSYFSIEQDLEDKLHRDVARGCVCACVSVFVHLGGRHSDKKKSYHRFPETQTAWLAFQRLKQLGSTTLVTMYCGTVSSYCIDCTRESRGEEEI